MCPCWITIQTTNDWAGVRYERGFVGFGVESGVGGESVYSTPLSESEGPVRNSADNGNFLSIPCPSVIFYFVGVGYQIDSSLFLPITPLLLLLRKRHPAASSCQPLSAALFDEFGRVSVVRR